MGLGKITDKMAQKDPKYNTQLNKNKKEKGSGGNKLWDIIKKNAKSHPNAIWNQGKGGSGKD